MELDNDLPLTAAATIADRLVDEALWGADQCTWLSADGPDDRVSTLDPWLYAGDCGVALFLSEAARLTGSRHAKDAARGATLRALAATEQTPRTPGLYEGTLGVAVAAVRVAKAIGDEQILEAARALACTEPPESQVGADLMAGNAGDILALITLADELADPLLLTLAGDRATKLIEAADNRLGMSWQAIDPREPNLTGLAHGAAGACMAFSELFKATRDRHLIPAIEACCAFERSHFNQDRANWVDLRRHHRRRRASAPDRFMIAWCHGGPGIALSRLSAFTATHDNSHLDEARIGALTALQTLDEANRSRRNSDWSLCHGLGGLIDVIGEYERLNPTSDKEGDRRARELAADDAKRFSGPVSWPCGTYGRQTPGLLIGLAGIGMTYLRLVDETIPSVLWVRPQNNFG